MGIRFLFRPDDGEFDFSEVTPDDVVIMPAFGVTRGDFQRLRALGCVLVDTTCGSVLNVWKRVESYARDGYTAIIHGKYWHEETKATASQVEKHPGGKYLVVLDMDEAREVMHFMEHGGDSTALATRFAAQVPAGFDFDRDLTQVGLANQTTMLSGESLAIAAEFRRTMERKHGADGVEAWVRSFDTICSATQERQDAVELLLQEPLDLMVVVGGYNSSNTGHLAELSSRLGVKTFHIEDAYGVDPDSGIIHHQTVGSKARAEARGWLEGVRTIGITAGASTPNNKIGETVVRICQLAGIDLDEALR
jgi:4-hydroxy-3-methylbut-2-enyl diphosphate reductase